MENLVKELTDDILHKRDVRSMRDVIESLDEAYAIQDKVVANLGATCGRKIALNTAAQMEKAGINKPTAGVILGSGPIANRASLRISDYSELAIEPEFVALLSTDIPADTVVQPANLMAVVEKFTMGFEVLEKRNAPADLHAPTFIVNNVFNAGCVVSETGLDPDRLQKGDYDALFTAVEDVKVQGKGTAPQNPLEACAFVVNHFTARGENLRKGELILCGAHHPPLSIKKAGDYVFSLSSGEAVSLSISD
ncbi:fumarylacetoacetate hydrolase family protein [Roseobacter sp. N2S]|uniref:fumarylacetoacetate hydrolase family protein n=1 Tax=Roseobacter sp. N2S TaxID=2663844 RepID=UPI00285D97E4|nr:fumarylacetoacetate hydrolase family protein [Roseobacter sp. N2S]MDR6266375.1 2-keto-4-pentenoate hydratase [Roseobacter sp. N2S]